MANAKIDFSAQFGGRDAAELVLPYFHALKTSAEHMCLAQFPVAKLAFILRVDGEVNEYHQIGPGNPEVNPSANYISIDIGVPKSARPTLADFLERSILQSDALIAQILQEHFGMSIDQHRMSSTLKEMLSNFQEIMKKNASNQSIR